jgi:hypothetical protein
MRQQVISGRLSIQRCPRRDGYDPTLVRKLLSSDYGPVCLPSHPRKRLLRRRNRPLDIFL